MKAIDYYNIMMEYPQTADGIAESVGRVVDMMNTEAKELIARRRAVRDSAVAAIIREQNNKWNAIIAIYEKKNGNCPLARNAIWKHWAKLISKINEYK